MDYIKNKKTLHASCCQSWFQCAPSEVLFLSDQFKLDEINKASERFQGLSDAAENQRAGQLRHLTSIN